MTSSPFFVPLSSEGALTAFLFPFAGGSASAFRGWTGHFGAAFTVLSVQLPGRQNRFAEMPFERMTDLAVALADEITARPPPGEFIFFGHSMGALIAAEVAVRLQGTPHAPRALIVSGRRAPSTVRDQRVHERDDEGLIAELKRLSGTDDSLLEHEEILRMTLPAVRNDYRAIETHPPRPDLLLDCPVTVLVGDDDPTTTVPEAERWREHTTGAFRLRLFPGGHFYLTDHQADVDQELAEALQSLA